MMWKEHEEHIIHNYNGVMEFVFRNFFSKRPWHSNVRHTHSHFHLFIIQPNVYLPFDSDAHVFTKSFADWNWDSYLQTRIERIENNEIPRVRKKLLSSWRQEQHRHDRHLLHHISSAPQPEQRNCRCLSCIAIAGHQPRSQQSRGESALTPAAAIGHCRHLFFRLSFGVLG